MMKKYQAPTKEFYRLPNSIFDLGLTPIQFTLYSYLVSCAGSKNYCWPSLETISAKTGIGISAVQKHLKILEKRQIIRIGKRKTRNGNWNNEYRLLSLDNPEIYRDLNTVTDELPLFIGEDIPA